jgi:hypothetical protein
MKVALINHQLRVAKWAARETRLVHEMNNQDRLGWDGLMIVVEVLQRFRRALKTWPVPPAGAERKALIGVCTGSALKANRRAFAEADALGGVRS